MFINYHVMALLKVDKCYPYLSLLESEFSTSQNPQMCESLDGSSVENKLRVEYWSIHHTFKPNSVLVYDSPTDRHACRCIVLLPTSGLYLNGVVLSCRACVLSANQRSSFDVYVYTI